MKPADDWVSLPTPDKMTEYLDATGWRRVRSTDASALYERTDPGGDRAQVDLPLDMALGDYTSGILRALRRMARVEDRDVETVYRAIFNPADTVDIWVPAEIPGVAPVGDVLGLFQAAKNLVLAAASAAVAPRASFGECHERHAHEFVESVMGSVLRGGFVVRLDCPVDPMLFDSVPSQPVRSTPHYGRGVTTMLLDAVRTTVALARSDHGRDAQAWHEAVQRGVSADLVDALSAISPRDQDLEPHEITVEFVRTLPTNGPARATVELPPGLRAPLRQGAAALRGLAGR